MPARWRHWQRPRAQPGVCDRRAALAQAAEHRQGHRQRLWRRGHVRGAREDLRRDHRPHRAGQPAHRRPASVQRPDSRAGVHAARGRGGRVRGRRRPASGQRVRSWPPLAHEHAAIGARRRPQILQEGVRLGGRQERHRADPGHPGARGGPLQDEGRVEGGRCRLRLHREQGHHRRPRGPYEPAGRVPGRHQEHRQVALRQLQGHRQQPQPARQVQALQPLPRRPRRAHGRARGEGSARRGAPQEHRARALSDAQAAHPVQRGVAPGE